MSIVCVHTSLYGTTGKSNYPDIFLRTSIDKGYKYEIHLSVSGKTSVRHRLGDKRNTFLYTRSFLLKNPNPKPLSLIPDYCDAYDRLHRRTEKEIQQEAADFCFTTDNLQSLVDIKVSGNTQVAYVVSKFDDDHEYFVDRRIPSNQSMWCPGLSSVGVNEREGIVIQHLVNESWMEYCSKQDLDIKNYDEATRVSCKPMIYLVDPNGDGWFQPVISKSIPWPVWEHIDYDEIPKVRDCHQSRLLFIGSDHKITSPDAKREIEGLF